MSKVEQEEAMWPTKEQFTWIPPRHRWGQPRREQAALAT